MTVRTLTPSDDDFEALFGVPAEHGAQAPGRINLIGEHTDTSGGFVLPIAVPLSTRVELRTRPGPLVRAWTANLDRSSPPAGLEDRARIEEYTLGSEAHGRGWLDYVQGVTWVLARERFVFGGFDLRIASDIPPGAGLASSAALTVALLRALRTAFGLELDDLRLALAARRAEVEFVGVPVGIMDPLAASVGDAPPAGRALFLDTRSLQHELVPFVRGAELAVIDSGIWHRHAAGEYRARQRECAEAAARMGVDQLRELAVSDLPRLSRLPSPLDRRARHVITENSRVLAAVRALREEDPVALGRLLDAGHRSLADDFEVSTPEIEVLAGLARSDPEVFGARLTGGGFGGSLLLLARQDRARAAAHRIAAAYGWRTGRAARVLLPTARQLIAAPAAGGPAA